MSARIHSVETIIVSHGLNFVYLFFMQIDGISTNVFLIESPGGGGWREGSILFGLNGENIQNTFAAPVARTQ